MEDSVSKKVDILFKKLLNRDTTKAEEMLDSVVKINNSVDEAMPHGNNNAKEREELRLKLYIKEMKPYETLVEGNSN